MNFTVLHSLLNFLLQFYKTSMVYNRFPLFWDSEKNRATDEMIQHAKCPKKNNLLANFYFSWFIRDPFLINLQVKRTEPIKRVEK